MAQCNTLPEAKHTININDRNVSPTGSTKIDNKLPDPQVEYYPNVLALLYKPVENN